MQQDFNNLHSQIMLEFMKNFNSYDDETKTEFNNYLFELIHNYNNIQKILGNDIKHEIFVND